MPAAFGDWPRKDFDASIDTGGGGVGAEIEVGLGVDEIL